MQENDSFKGKQHCILIGDRCTRAVDFCLITTYNAPHLHINMAPILLLLVARFCREIMQEPG